MNCSEVSESANSPIMIITPVQRWYGFPARTVLLPWYGRLARTVYRSRDDPASRCVPYSGVTCAGDIDRTHRNGPHHHAAPGEYTGGFPPKTIDRPPRDTTPSRVPRDRSRGNRHDGQQLE